MDEISVSILGVIILLAVLGFLIFFLITQQNTLKAIREENRLMRPGQVWLQLIPLYNYVWQFKVVSRISDSIRLEFDSRKDDSILGYSDVQAVEVANIRPTYDIGIAMCILNCCTLIRAPFLEDFIGIAELSCSIIYCKKLLDYKRMIQLRAI